MGNAGHAKASPLAQQQLLCFSVRYSVEVFSGKGVRFSQASIRYGSMFGTCMQSRSQSVTCMNAWSLWNTSAFGMGQVLFFVRATDHRWTADICNTALVYRRFSSLLQRLTTIVIASD